MLLKFKDSKTTLKNFLILFLIFDIAIHKAKKAKNLAYFAKHRLYISVKKAYL